MKTIGVRFDGGYKEYSYLCRDNTVEKGDWVVVMTPRGIPAIVTVTSVSSAVNGRASKPILYKLDKRSINYLALLQTEDANRFLDAKKRLDEKLAKFQALGQYQLLASHDKEAAKLLKIIEGV